MAKAKIANKMFADLPKSRLLKQSARINKIHGDSLNAYIMPAIKKVDLVFPFNRSYRPAFGIRQFWKHHLPTLKFHNYATEFNVLKVETENEADLKKCPIKVIVHDELNKHEINALDLQPNEILSKLVELTKATPVPESDLKQLNIEHIRR